MLKKIYNRLYADFLMPSRLGEYEKLIRIALENGYEHLTVYEFFLLVTENRLDPEKKYFIHRHDIDSDLKTTKAMAAIEKQLGIKSSYYFRLSTLDYPLMKALHAEGHEVSYHYEELATYCKKHKIKTPEGAKAVFPICAELFAEKVKQLESDLGFKFHTVASHGDFVNRELGIPNHRFVTPELLAKLNIAAETYDARILDNFSYTGSDCAYPKFYKPTNPFEAIEAGLPVVYLLSHPKHWKVNTGANIAEMYTRIKEGIFFKYL